MFSRQALSQMWVKQQQQQVTNRLLLRCLCLQRFPTDRAYFIAKELLTTERTYVKDLEVVTVVSCFLPPPSPLRGSGVEKNPLIIPVSRSAAARAATTTTTSRARTEGYHSG